jgi:DNA-binding response OmpR family regulator
MTDAVQILAVDDERDTVELIRLTLNTAGYRVDIATGGQQALDKIRSNAFDVIILDIMMPDISGFDVLRTLQEDQTPIPPVIFLTAKSGTDDQQIGINLGAICYLLKPITRGSLLDAINKALNPSTESDQPS